MSKGSFNQLDMFATGFKVGRDPSFRPFTRGQLDNLTFLAHEGRVYGQRFFDGYGEATGTPYNAIKPYKIPGSDQKAA